MAPGISTAHDIPSDDEVDSILNDVLDTSNDRIHTETSNNQNSETTAADLGIDKEITVTKSRKPAPKLDEARLLTGAGIPRLQKISKERLRFKGKGHEYRDIARMLNMYQLWLDDLYPRAKFGDGLTMIEKLGHTKRMQMIRKNLIYEENPKRPTEQDDDDVDSVVLDDTIRQHADEHTGETSRAQESSDDAPDGLQNRESDVMGEGLSDNPDADELDALLAENANDTIKGPPALHSRTVTNDDPFADDMEAMAEMEGMW